MATAFYLNCLLLQKHFKVQEKIKFINLAAAGFAVDRLEGDSIKIESCFAWQLGEALAVFGTAATKKIISMAAWWSIIFFRWCGVGYLHIMCLIGFFFRACLHEPG